MLRRAFWALAVAAFLAVPATVYAQGDYLDVYIAKVKPEKVADFNVIAKKMVDASRRFNGDRWIAMETMYGEGNTFVFVSVRADYADADKAGEAFMGAINKAYGKEGTEKLFHDWNSCLAGSRSELRRRRWDLSRKAPSDPAAYAKLVGESRVLRTTAVHVRPGRIAEFEALLKNLKAAGEQNANTQPVLVSQVVEGTRGTTFYITALRSSLGGFDKNPTVRDILGEEGFKKYLQANAESVENAESALYHFSPQLSNPPEEIMAAAPDFWHPKAIMAATSPKAKAAESKAGLKPTPAKAPAEKPQQ